MEMNMTRNSKCDGSPCTCTGAQIWSEGECLLDDDYGYGGGSELAFWGEQFG
jgi:hypothetical protein